VTNLEPGTTGTIETTETTGTTETFKPFKPLAFILNPVHLSKTDTGNLQGGGKFL